MLDGAEGTIENPIRQVRQSSKRVSEPDVLTVDDVSAILVRLTEPCRTVTLSAALIGLRRGELFGLQMARCGLRELCYPHSQVIG